MPRSDASVWCLGLVPRSDASAWCLGLLPIWAFENWACENSRRLDELSRHRVVAEPAFVGEVGSLLLVAVDVADVGIYASDAAARGRAADWTSGTWAELTFLH